MAGHEWEDWFEREEFIGQISDMRVQNLQVEREVVQKRTFTRWMNLHLEKCDPPIEVQDLFRDIQDGHILMALLEELSGCKLLHGFKRSSHRIFRLNNIAKVLSFLEERNVKLVSIDAADVADGNSSIILGLIWNIILFFQIKELTGNIRSQFPSCSSLSSIPTSSDSDTSFCSTPSDERQSSTTAMREHSKAIKKLLQWVQKRTRKFSVAVKDFGKSWTSGLAFLAVIKSIDPSLVDMRKALLRTARENLEDAFRTAHYSLGIPRLLEPEDVTINAPDEQSIMTYVSQFLEHFPGIEEEPCQLIERSVSMCRLNFRDSDSSHVRNGAHGSRVKERSIMFQKDCGQPPPKILLSSVSEDRGTMSRTFRPAAARSWSSEDILADSPHKEDTSSSVAKETKEVGEVDSTSDSPQLSYTHSPTGSSVPESGNTESVIGDSAISSPDSWVDSEFGVTPEKFCESRSDSSLCDSGTAWDVYRATPVEITTLDEGFVPSGDDKATDEQSITESYIDEGIYSLSSLESTQGHSGKKEVEVEREKEANPETQNQDMALESEPGDDKREIMKDVDSREMDKTLLQKGPREQEPPPPPEHLEDTGKQTSVEESSSGEAECSKTAVDFIGNAMGDHEGQINGRTEGSTERKREAEEETECQETESPSEETRGQAKPGGERSEVVVETQEKAKEEVQRDYRDPQESFGLETCKASSNTPSNQGEALKTSPEPITGMNIPLISISSEPEEQEQEYEPRQDHVGDDEVPLAEAAESKRSDTDVHSPHNPDELSCDSNNDKTPAESPSCLPSENMKPTDSNSERSVDKDRKDISRSSNSETRGPDMKERRGAKQERNTEEDSMVQTSSADVGPPPVNTDQEANLTDGHQDKLGDTYSETVSTQQNTVDQVNSRHNDDLVGDPIEPMDLFYPDKEEPMLPEPADSEMQSWPSVLSVSALQPAPASVTLPDEQPLSLLGEHFSNGVESTQDNVKMTNKSSQESENASESQENSLLPGEKTAGLWGDVPADGGDLSEAELQSLGRARENTEPVRSDIKSSSGQEENQIPPVLRHRKGLRFTESTVGQTPATRKDDSGDSDYWCTESCELYLLLLLWLLLYCFWLLPQMDLKRLPSLLLNLKH